MSLLTGHRAAWHGRSDHSTRDHDIERREIGPLYRPHVKGKMLFAGEDVLFIKGVTYGPFRPDPAHGEYGAPEAVGRDFARMAAHGINAVRTYTVPPRWLLDTAAEHGLRVMVGLPWEQHVTFLDERRITRGIREQLRRGVEACAGHPAVLAYSVGNEIPAPVVRWHGPRRIERFLRSLVDLARDADPAGLVTYVNYPTTEYLRLPFVDFQCFNVFLESQERLASYLARLQNVAGDQPLVLAEVGLDSLRHGEDVQARTLDWQTRTLFSAGCAGAFVFSWTDEWHRGGHDVEDWAFGLTDRQRRPKPALAAVRESFADAPFPPDLAWPMVSVVVCTYNGSRTLAQTLSALGRLDYPNYEVIVVNDGSTDGSADVARRYDVRLINLENGGLSNARNVGMRAAAGDIVAYIDDDAYPDPNWLSYLAHTFMTTGHMAVGGPNLPPPEDNRVAWGVAHAPGGPSHVLYTDQEVEHLPGCNMAFRKEALAAIGGFDRRFRIAGDDVDLCWRIQQRGWTLGFSAAAVVWHHRRDSVRAYLKQQHNYGKAEAMLQAKWPEKYNGFGHVPWQGRLYCTGPTLPLLLRRWRIYHGVWGTAPFQPMYARSPGVFRSLPLMPEWYLLVAVLAAVTLTGAVTWLAAPLLAAAAAVPLLQAAVSAAHTPPPADATGRLDRLKARGLVAFLHLAQPLVRLAGRMRLGLTPWRRGHHRYVLPRRRTVKIWSERWQAPELLLTRLEATVRNLGGPCIRGGEYDDWDLEVRGGFLGAARVLLAVEEHGSGRQQFKLRARPRVVPGGALMLAAAAALAGLSLHFGHAGAFLVAGCGAAALAVRTVTDCAYSMATFLEAARLER